MIYRISPHTEVWSAFNSLIIGNITDLESTKLVTATVTNGAVTAVTYGGKSSRRELGFQTFDRFNIKTVALTAYIPLPWDWVEIKRNN